MRRFEHYLNVVSLLYNNLVLEQGPRMQPQSVGRKQRPFQEPLALKDQYTKRPFYNRQHNK